MSIQQFLQQVGMQIQSREARIQVIQELNGHLQDAKQSYINNGDAEAVAEAKAIDTMGSSLQLGRKMNQLHRPKTDWLLIGLFIAALGLGFLPIWLENAVYGNDYGHLYGRKAIHIGICIVVACCLYFVDYRKLWYGRGYVKMAAIGLTFLFGQFATFQVDGEIGVQIGPVMLTEIILIPLYIVAWAVFLSNHKRQMSVVYVYFIITAYLLTLFCSLKMILLYIVISMSQILISHYSKREKWFMAGLVVLTVVIPAILFLIETSSFAMRFKVLINPEAYADTAGYLALLIQQIRENAGWSGSGQFVDLPNSYTNFALVSVLQGLGYGGVIVVILVLCSLLVKLLWNSWLMQQQFGKQLVIGTTTFYGFVVLYILAMLFGLVPIIDIGVPFVSFSFTNLLVFTILIGLVLSVYRRKSLTERVFPRKKPYIDFIEEFFTMFKVDEEEEKLRQEREANMPKWLKMLNRIFE